MGSQSLASGIPAFSLGSQCCSHLRKIYCLLTWDTRHYEWDPMEMQTGSRQDTYGIPENFWQSPVVKKMGSQLSMDGIPAIDGWDPRWIILGPHVCVHGTPKISEVCLKFIATWRLCGVWDPIVDDLGSWRYMYGIPKLFKVFQFYLWSLLTWRLCGVWDPMHKHTGSQE